MDTIFLLDLLTYRQLDQQLLRYLISIIISSTAQSFSLFKVLQVTSYSGGGGGGTSGGASAGNGGGKFLLPCIV